MSGSPKPVELPDGNSYHFPRTYLASAYHQSIPPLITPICIGLESSSLRATKGPTKGQGYLKMGMGENKENALGITSGIKLIIVVRLYAFKTHKYGFGIYPVTWLWALTKFQYTPYTVCEPYPLFSPRSRRTFPTHDLQNNDGV